MKESKNVILPDTTWQFVKTDIFWNKEAAHSQVFNFYDDDNKLIELLAGFVGTGINVGDCSVVICSKKHILDLNNKLSSHGLHVDTLIADARYIPVDAEVQLSEFMAGNLPDQNLFQKSLLKLLYQAKRRNRKIRIYREMVTLLKEQGNHEAHMLLEQYWREFRRNESLSLFCGYPRYSLGTDDCGALQQLYGGTGANIKIVANAVNALEISYKNCDAA